MLNDEDNNIVSSPLIVTVKVITTRQLLKESFDKLTAVLLNKDEDGNEVRLRMDIYRPQLRYAHKNSNT